MLYILDAKPHSLRIFNKLEFLNETALILLGYMSLAFTGLIQNYSRVSTLIAELIAQLTIGFIVIANLYVLVSKTVTQIKLKLAKKKLEKRAR